MNALGEVAFHPVRIPMRMRFRRVSWREAVLVEGPEGWGEFSPFPDYPPEITVRWLAAALEAACSPWPEPVRSRVEVNTTVPAVPAPVAAVLVAESGCSTAKVKVGEPGQTFAEDVERVAAVRQALGPQGRIRIDVNAGWSVPEAVKRIERLQEYQLEYVEQPVATIDEIAELAPQVDVKIAADEAIRLSDDPMSVIERGVIDLLVLKVQPLGGMRRLLDLARRSGLPVVVSSALDTSVGLAAGLAAAAALPDLPYACGLGTASLLAGDVVEDPLMPVDGWLEVRRPVPSPALLEQWMADRETASRLTRRLRQAADLLT
ncbi:MAG: o-succinylbenzoate synthase [Acidimicrobiia bacterium]